MPSYHTANADDNPSRSLLFPFSFPLLFVLFFTFTGGEGAYELSHALGLGKSRSRNQIWCILA